MPPLNIKHLFALSGFEVPYKQQPDLDIGLSPNTRTKYRAQYKMYWPDGKPHYMGSSYPVSPWALRLEQAGIEITWLNGYRGKSTDELALSTPAVPLDVVGAPCSDPGATSNHLLSTRLGPHHFQSYPQHDHHWNQQDRPWQPHQSPTTMGVGYSAPLDHASFPTQVAMEEPAKRGPGRPPGSKNKPKSANPEGPKEKRKPGRPPGSKNKPKVNVVSGGKEYSPNLQYKNNGRAKKDNIGQERREHKIAFRHNSGANLFSQNQQVVHQHVQTQQPLSAGQALPGFRNPTTVAQNNDFGQNRIHDALPTKDDYQGNGAYEHLSSWLGQQVDTSQPLSTNTVADYRYPTTIGPRIEYMQKMNEARLSLGNRLQASQACDHHLTSSQNQHVHTQQPLSTDTSLPTAHTNSSSIAQNDYVGQDEYHYALRTDEANQASQTYDALLPTSQDQHVHTQHLLSAESLSGSTFSTTMDQQDNLVPDGNFSTSPAPITDQWEKAIDECLALARKEQEFNDLICEEMLSEEEMDRLRQSYPSPSGINTNAQSQSATASTDCLVDPELLVA